MSDEEDWVSTFRPRRPFKPLHERKTRWFIGVTHRRAGKTVANINELIESACLSWRYRSRFAYVAPHLNQAKEIAWNYLKDYTAFIPNRRINESELWIGLPGDNKPTIRLYGADNPDRLRGAFLDGVVLDEFGDMDPTFWPKVIRPMLSDRQGWASIIGTPKGRNGFHRLWEQAADDPDWTRLMLKASDTKLIDAKELADARKAMTDDEYAQEYECSFDAAVRGAYYAKELNRAEAEGRITAVPHDPRLPVYTAWDLGMADSTVIWFVQVNGREIRLIDLLKGEGVGLDWYAKRILERDWLWGGHYLPHDVKVREMGTGKSRIETLAGLGIRATISPFLPIEDGIQAVRMLLPTCWIDREKCRAGIEALRMYRRDFNARGQEYEAKPRHDWTSHYADALRCFAVGHRPPLSAHALRKPKRDTRWVV